MNVLLVDDDDLLRAVLAEALEDEGFQVFQAADPDEALGLSDANGPPTVLITDIDLGAALTGFDVAAAARRRWPEVSVVLISDLPMSQIGRSIDPRDHYLAKPFPGDRLVGVIKELVTAE